MEARPLKAPIWDEMQAGNKYGM
ncbi:uncharacterized protein G2W53_000896 [Senna tora]|uniref:Uncharacterized protein n=1 Tax=Senna tora TaxID=362788 RepID=A0A835CJW3_9FABA|nr:uncharacterized protein G2W53_000896 [Senna tora]